MKYDLGIVGGLGPMASSYLYEMITKETKVYKDQEHLNIALLSYASTPDRTNFILGESDESPYPYLLQNCKILEKLGAKMISIPCNTSCFFHEKLQSEINVPINNLVKNTCEYVSNKNYKKVAILATTGTINSNLYQNYLDKYSIEYVLPDQNKVMEIIYDYIKCGKEVSLDLLKDVTDNLNVDAYILGCTELSILKSKLNLDDNFIDPLEIECKNILNFFGKG